MMQYTMTIPEYLLDKLPFPLIHFSALTLYQFKTIFTTIELNSGKEMVPFNRKTLSRAKGMLGGPSCTSFTQQGKRGEGLIEQGRTERGEEHSHATFFWGTMESVIDDK